VSDLSSSNLPPRPLPRGVILVSNLSGGLVLGICIIFIFVLLFQNESGIEARDARLAFKPSENGHPLEDGRLIPVDAKEIYLQYYLEKRGKIEVPLEFRWYANEQLVYSSLGDYGNGYVTAYLEFEPNEPGGLPAGDYHVEVWFRNTMILSEAFVVE
jgi:hypothetical protein